MGKTKAHTHFEQLKNKWVIRHREVQKNLWDKHAGALTSAFEKSKRFAVGSLGGVMLLGATTSAAPLPPSPILDIPQATPAQQTKYATLSKNTFLINDLYKVLPQEVRPLTPEEEERAVAILSERFQMPIKAEIDGKRLNRSYGYIGKEQHLARFSGDTMATHFSDPEQARLYGKEGMAPGLGAWGYFAQGTSLTETDIAREKYYIAVQTFLSKDFNERFGEYRDFYKYRKMLVVNPQNGKAMVVVIGDAGPAEWTGKSLGGSPEVMGYLERVDGKQKGPVLYFFLDDPNDTIPLGPLEVQ